LVATSATGCVGTTATKTLVVNPLPTAQFMITAPDCINKDISFTDASLANAGTLTSWNWDLGDGTTFISNNNNLFTHSYTTTGNFTATLIVKTDKGCTSTLF